MEIVTQKCGIQGNRVKKKKGFFFLGGGDPKKLSCEIRVCERETNVNLPRVTACL